MDIFAILLSALLPMLLGGNKGSGVSGTGSTDRTVTTETPPRGYQSPMLGLMDPLMADQLLRQFQSYSGAGMPGGVGNTSPGLQGILDLLGGDWGELLGQYEQGQAGAAPGATPARVQSPLSLALRNPGSR